MAPVRGHNIAKMGLEAAVWDLLGQAQGRSVSQLLGGTRDRVPVGVSIGVQDSVPALLDRIGDFWEPGLQPHQDQDQAGWDVDVVRQVRQRFPDVPLMVDANSAYTLADADHLAALDEFDLMMIEQPLAYDDLVDHAELQRRLRTPICLDESVPSLAAARAALALGSGRIINIKAGTRRRADRGPGHPRPVPGAGRAGVVRRHAGDGHRPGAQRGPGQPARFYPAGRHFGQRPLLPPGPRRAGLCASTTTGP